jgi:CheY-like chemotaxis protein
VPECRHGFAVPCILVIEDEGLIGSVTAETLADEGYEVLTVAVGCGALQPVLDWRPCLILLDILMLVMDRLAFLRKLWRLDKRAQTPWCWCQGPGAAAQRGEHARRRCHPQAVQPRPGGRCCGPARALRQNATLHCWGQQTTQEARAPWVVDQSGGSRRSSPHAIVRGAPRRADLPRSSSLREGRRSGLRQHARCGPRGPALSVVTGALRVSRDGVVTVVAVTPRAMAAPERRCRPGL